MQTRAAAFADAPAAVALAVFALGVFVPVASAVAAPRSAGDLAETYATAVQRVNEAHARKPGDATEAELAERLPKAASKALEALLAEEAGAATSEALVVAGEAALDLDLMADFARIRERVAAESPESAARLGVAVSRTRFLVRGLDGLGEAYLERFADVVDAILDGYDEVFGFHEWSKVPGKKLRFRVHLVPKITRPPHFAPQYPFHSEVDFPVADADTFTSPTADGKFLFYGLCHELGHVIAMWGDRSHEEDHHAWAHYTGVAIVEHLAQDRDEATRAVLEGLRDVRWRSLSKERERTQASAATTDDRDGVLRLLIEVHDLVGPDGVGAAIDLMDREDRGHRINHVRYYGLKAFERALREVRPKQRKKLAKLFAQYGA